MENQRFEEYLTRFGAPVIWSTDNGGEFKSRLIQALCKVYGTRKQFSMSYHPASNGACERMNRTIIAELSKRINQFGTNWAPQLKWVEFAYNVTPHTAMKISPYVLWYGREPRTPFEAQIPLVKIAEDQMGPPNDNSPRVEEIDYTGWDKDARQYYEDVTGYLKNANEMVEEHHQKYRENMIRQTSKQGLQNPFVEGDKVWSLLPREAKFKSSLNYDGPWEVIKRLGSGNSYVIRKGSEEALRPVSDLKPYEEPLPRREVPSPPLTLQESTTDVLTEQKQTGQITKPLEMLLSIAHLITGGRATPTTTRMKGPEDETNIQHVHDVHDTTELRRVTETEELTTRDEQSYDTGQDFSDPFEGEVTNEHLREENDLNDPLSSGAWTPTFVYESTKQGSTPGQSEYDSVDSSGRTAERHPVKPE